VRLIIGECGRIRVRTEMVIRFGYGATVPWMTNPRTGRLLSDFPQALSHITLINSAFNLNEATKPAMQRSDSPMNNSSYETAN
jgi:hypothetical protein